MKKTISFALVLAAAATVFVRAQTVSLPSDEFFNDSVVHSIYIDINSRDWQTLRENYLANDYFPANLRYNGQTVRNIGIRSRGTGSRSGIKPGLRVDFDRYTADQKFNGLKSFILRNQTQDPSNMHERISMLLFQRLGVKVSREAYTRLYINNVYSGLYTLVESVDKTFLKNSFNEDEGYLYKYDYNSDDKPWFFEDKGIDSIAYTPHPLKPETHEIDTDPMPIVELVQSVNKDNDAAFQNNMAQYVDWKNFTTHIAIETVLSDQDGFNGDYGINNFYLYRMKNTKKFIWIPWDKSEAFKNASDLAIFHNFLDGDPARRNRLSGRAMTIPGVRAMYLDALVAAAKSLTQRDAANPADTRGWMEREIQRQYEQIRDLVYADVEKPFTNAQFEAEVERLRAFARERGQFVIDAVEQAKIGT